MPSGADLEYARMLAAAGVDPASPAGYDGARLEQMGDEADATGLGTLITRSAFNALRLSRRPNGSIAIMDGLAYKCDYSVALADSATWDLGVAGIVPMGNVTPEHFGAQVIGSTALVDPEFNGGSSALFNAGLDSGESLKRAVAHVNKVGGSLFLSAGVYKTSVTIVMDSGTFIRGQGYSNTSIRLANGANKDIITTRGFGVYYNTDSWIVNTTGIPWGYGLEELTLDGNRDNNTAGFCFKGYGKIRSVWNCMFKNAYEWGFHNAAGQSRGQTDSRDIPEARIWAICRKNRIGGFWAFGPHDWMIDHLICAMNGRDANDWDIKVDTSAQMEGGGRVKFAHTYGGPASGIKLDGQWQGDHIVAENGMVINGSGCYLNLVQNGSAIYGKALEVNGGGCLIGETRLSTNDPTHSGLLVTGSDLQIGVARLQGDVGSSGIGMDVRADGFKVGSARILYFTTALKLGAVNQTHARLDISSCDTGIDYQVAGKRNVLDARINTAGAAVPYSGVTPDATDRFDLLEWGAGTKRTRKVIRMNGAVDAVGLVTITFNPNLMWVPSLANISVSIVGSTVTDYVMSVPPHVSGNPTATSVAVKYRISTAGTAGGLVRIALTIDASVGEVTA